MVIFSESSKMPIARGTRPKSIEIFLKRVIQAVTLAGSIFNPSKILILVYYYLLHLSSKTFQYDLDQILSIQAKLETLRLRFFGIRDFKIQQR